jgi:photosystem II stability/assembly factor-like uncharacterized protein
MVIEMKKAIVLFGFMVLFAGGASAQWYIQYNGPNAVFFIDFADTLHGVATGTETALSLVTTNGGANWIGAPGAAGSVCMVNERRGFSTANAWVTTTDGGFTWNYLSPLAFFIQGLSFVDSVHGWATGANGKYYVIATTDGGYTWAKQCSLGGTFFGVCAVDTLHVWVCTYEGGDDTLSISATRDGDRTWTRQRTPQLTSPLTSIFFLDSLKGWAVGAPPTSTTAIYTTNGGVTWFSAVTGPNLRDVVFPDSLFGWAVGEPNHPECILVSTDGGRTWSPQTSPVPYELWAVDFVGRRKGWIVCTNGFILHTENGAER